MNKQAGWVEQGVGAMRQAATSAQEGPLGDDKAQEGSRDR